ncbi:CPO [Lepeophtheirus salmonis]|uniref:CPO n=1 Tax=Lepeophtheirus salmonis TaxID=72036 RepID=A0A7R8H3U2_LEPSM|nr:CPO [Lepeophtheirus salmonis]CAF2837170.1 CPO [Lepeophtheirus salmonis]
MFWDIKHGFPERHWKYNRRENTSHSWFLLLRNMWRKNQPCGWIPLMNWIGIFMPIVNPDGYVYSMEHDSNWRTNRAKHSKCIGVDINRNFPLNLGGNREIATFIKEHLESIKFYNSLHCYGELILFPWASTKNKFQTEASHYELGKKGLKAITLSSGHGYKIGSAAKVLYTAKGSSIDYFTKIGIPYVYAMEIGTAFIPNVKEILPLAKDVLGFHVSIAEEIIEEFS